MASNMEQIARACFPAAKRVTYRFHVQKLPYEAVQEMRVKARWEEAPDEESTQIAYAKAYGRMYHAPVFENGDSPNNCWQGAFTCFTRKNLFGLNLKGNMQIFFLENIPI